MTTTRTAPRCTVCGRHEARPTIYGCRPFVIRQVDGDPFTAPDAWLTCAKCTTHVEAHNLDALTERMTCGLAHARQSRTGRTPEVQVIERAARQVCAAFLAMREEHPTEQERTP